MRILFLNFRDRDNPAAGGSEMINEEIVKRLVRDGHEVVLIAAGFKGSQKEQTKDGYRIIRLGNRWTVYWLTWRYYRKNLDDWTDAVVEVVNTVPFFSKYYSHKPKTLFVHQLCREVWFYQLPFPLGLIGYLVEPIYLRLLCDMPVITVSDSSKKDLLHNGFHPEKISIIREGIELTRSTTESKFSNPTVLSLGSVRPMKRTIEQIAAFELAKRQIPDLKMIIAGDFFGLYGRRFLHKINKSPFVKDISFLGKVTKEKKQELMQKSQCLLVTSVKEGWGLVVTEANSQGTPALVYDVDGLRDSVINGKNGLISRKNTPYGLSDIIVRLFKENSIRPEKCLEVSADYTPDNCYKDFKKGLERAE